VVQLTSLECGGCISASTSLSLSIEGVCSDWFRRCAFGSHAGEWLALALAILVLFALRIALSRLVFWFLQRKRDTDESEDESDYWRIHGG
jgi:hypothetical protein